uniref:(California timema) hypothetical protein n=1 Tax=Timema californicum TaxID=61474 RepID=A0A7R9J5Y9_TIMCA|nr:unnamed protein product [Timema californicum]
MMTKTTNDEKSVHQWKMRGAWLIVKQRLHPTPVSSDRLLEINGHPLPSYQKATDLLRNGPDLVKLRLQRKARHESSTASPTCRRNKRRLHHQLSPDSDEDAMGSNVSHHSEKGLSGRRTQSSGNLCNGNKLLAPNVARILVPCTGVGPKDRNKFCGSLPNHLDGKPSPGDPGDTPESCCNGNNNNDEYLQRFRGDYLTMTAPSSSSSVAAQHQQHNQHHHQQTKNKRNELELRLHPLDSSVLYDQGYGSERSPEEEHPLKAPQPDVCQGRPLEYPFITPGEAGYYPRVTPALTPPDSIPARANSD